MEQSLDNQDHPERNCWAAVLTEEERTLLGEFLDV